MDLQQYVLELHAMGKSRTEIVAEASLKGVYDDAEIFAAVSQLPASNPAAARNQAQAVRLQIEEDERSRLEDRCLSAEDLGERVGYVYSPLVQCCLPYRRLNPDGLGTGGEHFTKSHGSLSVTLATTPRPKPINTDYTANLPAQPIIPYGSLGRLIFAHIATKAVRTQSRVVQLGVGPAELLGTLGVRASYGKKGSVLTAMTMLDGFRSLTLSTEFQSQTNAGTNISWRNMYFVDSGEMWFDTNWDSGGGWFELGSLFYESLNTHSFPIDLLTLRSLFDSPMAMDVYTLLSYKSATLKRPQLNTWSQLRDASGSTSNNLRAFKQDFLAAIEMVRPHYNGFRVEVTDKGLTVYPARAHIGRSTRA